MFIAAGALAAVGVIGGVISHSDHSDYSDYYSDYAERERKRKKAELNAKEKELEALKQQLENECNELYRTIEDEVNDSVPYGLRNLVLADENPKKLLPLKQDRSDKLNKSLIEDKNELQEINNALKRINEIQLQAKKSVDGK